MQIMLRKVSVRLINNQYAKFAGNTQIKSKLNIIAKHLIMKFFLTNKHIIWDLLQFYWILIKKNNEVNTKF